MNSSILSSKIAFSSAGSVLTQGK